MYHNKPTLTNEWYYAQYTIVDSTYVHNMHTHVQAHNLGWSVSLKCSSPVKVSVVAKALKYKASLPLMLHL